MKKTILIIGCLSLFLLQCKKEEHTPEIKPTVLTANTCYEFSDGQNLASFEIQEVNSKVKASLSYKFKNQDSKEGLFEGTIENNILQGTFTFISNGILSNKEVIFTVEEGKITEGKISKVGTAAPVFNFENGFPYYQIFCTQSKCKFNLGYVYSNILDTCIIRNDISIALDPLENGISINGPKAYIMIDEASDTVEIFLPDTEEGIVLEKTDQGHWSNDVYRFFDWKGWVLQKGDMAIFGGY